MSMGEPLSQSTACGPTTSGGPKEFAQEPDWPTACPLSLIQSASVTPFELGQTTGSTSGWTALYPVFVRGQHMWPRIKEEKRPQSFKEFSTIAG